MPLNNIDAKTLKQWLDNGEAIVIDVREPAEHASENIEDSNLIPLSTVNKSSLPNSHGQKIIVHCRSGTRSIKACEKLLAEDPSLELYNLEGGISSWMQCGYEIKSSGKFTLSLDRQVQLIIGIFVFVGSILTFFISPLFLLLTGFFGLGLIFAGITGTCTFAKLIAKMPWNQ